MDISVKGKNISVGDALRGYVSEQLRASVTKYFARAHDGVVIVSREAHLFRVDISVHPVAGFLVQGHGAAEDPHAAFDAALERVAKQIRRYKRRISNHHQRGVAEETTPAQQYILAAESGEKELPDGAQPAIIAELPTEIATLSVSEAVMRLDLEDAPAMMFRNRAHGTLNVVYRRADGNIGWIDPSRIQGT
jgi:ribosomal subunit interface protein